jgi:hypothetical protein
VEFKLEVVAGLCASVQRHETAGFESKNGQDFERVVWTFDLTLVAKVFVGLNRS